MKIVSDFPYKVTEHADMGITMSDGCRLSARVWMPEKAEQEPMPVILEHLPYRKRDGTIARDQFTHPWFAGHGYVCIRTDIRGNGDSEGLMKDEYSPQELADAAEIIEWAAKQPWCNGKVGMMGISWGGFNALQLAYMQPEPLKAIVTVCSTVDRYADDIHYKGGCLLGENFAWASNMLSYSSRPPDPALVGENKWKTLWTDRLQHLEFDLAAWLKHQHRDAYWKHGSVCEDYSRIWIHKYPHYAAPKPAIGFLQECKRWWDKYLKGIDTGIDEEADYRTYVMDSIAPERWLPERPGRWIAEQTWPSQNIKPLNLYLLGDDSLSDEPGNTAATISSPQDCGLCAGEYFPFAFAEELPLVTFTLTSDKPDAHLSVRLLDLRPDGTSALITWGVLNLTHINSHEHPQALTTGREITFSFTLDQIAYRLPAGHKIRVALSSAYWPTVYHA